jgi:tRNA-2-methylthio-N6-dimethylallyladenosine synthase
MPDDVSEEEKKRRNQILLEAQDAISREKNQTHIGKRFEVLVEGLSKTNPHRQTGRTDTHQIVNFEAGRELRGQFVTVEIISATAYSLVGRLV